VSDDLFQSMFVLLDCTVEMAGEISGPTPLLMGGGFSAIPPYIKVMSHHTLVIAVSHAATNNEVSMNSLIEKNLLAPTRTEIKEENRSRITKRDIRIVGSVVQAH